MSSKVALLNTCVSGERLLSRFSWVHLCNSPDCSPPGSSVHGIPQAEILEWLGMPSSKGSAQARNQTSNFTSPELAGVFFTTNATWEAQNHINNS